MDSWASDHRVATTSCKSIICHCAVATPSQIATMSQPSPSHEEGDVQEDNVLRNETTTSASGSGGVPRGDYEIMKGIVDHLTEAKDEK